MARYPDLTPEQIEALRRRFGTLLDVDKELREAREYAEQFASREYRSFPQFARNWLLRSEKDALARRDRAQTGQPRPAPSVQRGLTEAQLRAIADDPAELPVLRDEARKALRDMGIEG